MSVRIVAKFDSNIVEVLNRKVDEIADALRGAVENASTSLQQELRDQVRQAGLGDGLANAWQIEIYPKQRNRSWRPQGMVYSKATRLHEAFNLGGVISARNAHWLVIPLPAAVQLGLATDARQNKDTRNRGLNRKWSNVDAAVDMFGDLRFVPLGNGGRALLVADKRNQMRAPGHKKTRLFRDPSSDLPLFLLVRQATGRKVLDIEAAEEHARVALQRNMSNIARR